MRMGWRSEEGAGLVLVIAAAAVLAILATTLVAVTNNTWSGTATTRKGVQAFNYAEAGLNSAMAAATAAEWPVAVGSSFGDTVDLAAAYEVSFPEADRPELTILSYDNLSPINMDVTYDSNGDGVMWLDAQAGFKGEVARVRSQIMRATSQSTSTFPNAAMYTDGDIYINTGYVSGEYPDGTPYVDDDGVPLAAIYAVGSLDRNSWSWPDPSTIGFKLNGIDDHHGIITDHDDNVSPVSTVFPQATVDSLVAQAMVGSPTHANENGRVISSSEKSDLEATHPQNFTASEDLVVEGDLTLGGGESWFTFQSLYVTGDLDLTGNTHTLTTALYVGGDFSVSGPSGMQTFGPTYVAGNINWNGAASADCSMLYVGGNFWSGAGPFEHVLGPTYIAGDCTFSGNQAGIIAPLIVTTGNVSSSGSAYIGNLENPTLLLSHNGGDGSTKTIDWGSNGVFTGLMANMAGGVTVSAGGNGSMNDVLGSIISTGDISIPNNAGLTYIPDIMTDLPTTTDMTSVMPVAGTWQELKPL